MDWGGAQCGEPLSTAHCGESCDLNSSCNRILFGVKSKLSGLYLHRLALYRRDFRLYPYLDRSIYHFGQKTRSRVMNLPLEAPSRRQVPLRE